ncbi:DUF3488 and transglutaminase-like domain-containing protein [Neptunomonas sp. XY-337]|uniref:DUF3488 and transglutaminase-like domain-containing protein n=1 Tax=Neptunomonas sp. XY-337 TaxID=2561897 RepID=UPI0010AB428B|nr:DUF3488 and transglutaminase-like domain-containing protein [Neptunomonas sp. XY-337]
MLASGLMQRSSSNHWVISLYFLLATLPGLSVMPASFALPLAFLISGIVLVKAWLPANGKAVLIVVSLVIWAICVHWLLDDWLSGHTFLSGLYLVVTLKWIESKGRTESMVVTTIGLVLFALSSLSFSGFTALAYLLLGVCGYLYVTLLLSGTATTQMVATSAKILVLGTPIMVLLFVTVPRIQGPLWDLGIVMGLPIELVIDQDQKEQGLTASLQAGQISRLKKSDEPILVAEFSGTVPYKSRLYWRGPVYSNYTGTEWQMRPNWDNRTQLLRKAFRKQQDLDSVITSKRDLVAYEARITANGKRWMYGLDFPYGSSPETFISDEFQVLGIRKLRQEFNYEQRAYLEYTGGRPLSQEERQRFLQLPKKSNRRLVAWGRDMAKGAQTTNERIHRLRVQLASGEYQVTQLPDIDVYPDSLDEFFFERKQGGVEHLASASAIALRAAGVPTRLVSGYRGGSLIALTNFVVVRQANAHVWVEAWDDAIGWQRVEPLDFVTPPKKEERAQAEAPIKKPKVKNSAQAATDTSSAPSVATKTPTKRQERPPESNLSWLRTLSSGLETWVLNYNPETQVELMKKSGLRVVDWKSLLGITALGLALLGTIYGAVLAMSRRRRNNVLFHFEKLNHRLSSKGLECLPHECPHQWLQRIEEPAAQMYPAIAAVVQDYINLRYTPAADAAERQAREARFITNSKRLYGMLS